MKLNVALFGQPAAQLVAQAATPRAAQRLRKHPRSPRAPAGGSLEAQPRAAAAQARPEAARALSLARALRRRRAGTTDLCKQRFDRSVNLRKARVPGLAAAARATAATFPAASRPDSVAT